MNTSAIYHRPESEFAYLYQPNMMHIRLRTAKEDIKTVKLLAGDPYNLHSDAWISRPQLMEKYLTTDLHDYWLIETTAPFKRLSYAFELTGNSGEVCFYGDHGVFPPEEQYYFNPNNYFRLPYFHEIDRVKVPEWIKQTVWYQIFPERFANGDTTNDPAGTLPWDSNRHPERQDFFGGDLEGVIAHLDHLVELGINGIYFCPIFKAHSNHKYDTIDYKEIDPDFGDKKTFKRLVDACHARGIKVMLDAVFNHMGDTSPQWQDVLANGENSKYADWFHVNQYPAVYTQTDDFEFSGDASYDTFAFTPHMPKLNTANPEVINFLLDITTYWIREFDIDAWRLDVANEVDHHFWKKFKSACAKEKKDFYILGEIWHSSQSWLNGDEFDAVMNYAFTDSIIQYLIKKEISLEKMIAELNNQLMSYRTQTNQVMFNVLDSHDTPRIKTVAGENPDLVKQAMTFMYLHQGVPCLYYGTEFGLSGAMDPDCRKCMPWDTKDQDLDMFSFCKNLIRFRRDNQEILSEGKLEWLEVNSENGLIIFSRSLNGQTITGYFNSGQADIPLIIENPQFAGKYDGALLQANGYIVK